MHKYQHVCTCYVHVHVYTVTKMYIHVHEFGLMYVHGTYMYIDVDICMDTVQTCLCMFTTTLHFPSFQDNRDLARMTPLHRLGNLSLLRQLVKPCTYIVHTSSGFLPGTASYVYVRCRTYTLRHRTSDVRCRVQHRTYDIVRTILHTILYVRHRTFVNIVGATYYIVCPTYDIVGAVKSMSYTMSYVCENLRCRMLENVYRIRCRRYLSYTMSYVFA
jgi:hypothetical protein